MRPCPANYSLRVPFSEIVACNFSLKGTLAKGPAPEPNKTAQVFSVVGRAGPNPHNILGGHSNTQDPKQRTQPLLLGGQRKQGEASARSREARAPCEARATCAGPPTHAAKLVGGHDYSRRWRLRCGSAQASEHRTTDQRKHRSIAPRISASIVPRIGASIGASHHGSASQKPRHIIRLGFRFPPSAPSADASTAAPSCAAIRDR